MSNKKQNSVDWLVDKLCYEVNGQWFIGIREDCPVGDYIQQARAMHREEITQAYSDGLGNGMHNERGEGSDSDLDEYKYYNQTFNPESE